MIKVSVIIPVCNSEKYLKKCLNSVINQTLKEIEIICVNDCSTDNSLNILKEYSNKDNRIKIIHLKENKGASYARNIGIEQALGKYIGFVDSDDFIDFDFYEKLYEKANKTNADAVRGEFLVIDDSHIKPFNYAVYDLNNLIEKDYAWFYYTFTAAIFNRNFILGNDIKFPVGFCHMEDNYFTIKAITKYKTVKTVEGVNYYYLTTDCSRKNKPKIGKTIKSMQGIIPVILELINSSDIKENSYMIIFSFILKQVTEYCEKYKNETFYSVLSGILDYMNENCKYKNKILSSYYDYQKALNRDNELIETSEDVKKHSASEQDILAEYKEYSSFLGKNEVKILVSYIKPSFLFKSNVLTPIHLGRAVEKENSKDGVITDEDLNWLHENCTGDDNFEGNISSYNRRIGFFTGTWWAYKNYEKLGSPEYFGSYGYRRLLEPYYLLNLQDYDMILPKKLSLQGKTNKQLMIYCHSIELYNSMMEVFKSVYPEEYTDINTYLNLSQGYYCEIYVLKKSLFFDFCEWIYKYVIEFLNKYPQRVKKFIPFQTIIGGDYKLLDFLGLTQEEFNKNFNSDKKIEERDLAFILERLTGYYLWKLTKNKNLSYMEVPMLEIKKDDKDTIKQMILSKIRKNVLKDYQKKENK